MLFEMVVSRRRGGYLAAAVGGLKAGSRAVRSVGRIAKASRRVKKSFGKKEKAKSAVGDNDVLTNQYDTKLVYRRSGRRRSGGKGSRGKRFASRVNAVINRNQVSNTVKVLSSNVNSMSAGTQGVMFQSLFTGDNQVGGSAKDIYYILDAYLADSTATGSVENSQKKIMFTYAVLDLLIQNTDPNFTQVVDVYSLVPKRDLTVAMGNQGWIGLWNQGFTLSGAGSVIGVPPLNPGPAFTPGGGSPGMGPFENPFFCRFVTVMENRRFVLSPGQVCTLQMKTYPKKLGYKAAAVWLDAMTTTTGTSGVWAWKGVTKAYMICHKAVGAGNTTATVYPAANLLVRSEKSYGLKTMITNQNPTFDTNTVWGLNVQGSSAE